VPEKVAAVVEKDAAFSVLVHLVASLSIRSPLAFTVSHLLRFAVLLDSSFFSSVIFVVIILIVVVVVLFFLCADCSFVDRAAIRLVPRNPVRLSRRGQQWSQRGNKVRERRESDLLTMSRVNLRMPLGPPSTTTRLILSDGQSKTMRV
jgi:hypothetical protein